LNFLEQGPLHPERTLLHPAWPRRLQACIGRVTERVCSCAW
jgi:hypothetical protein